LGLAFKENVPDLRNSKVGDLVRRLKTNGHTVSVHDPLADAAEALSEYGIKLCDDLPNNVDCVVGCVAHTAYHDLKFANVLNEGGLIADLKGVWRGAEAVKDFRYWTL
ncbi:MAG: UDP-glucose/GDP-mannose dehydrogenase family protein, partial [Pseudomonadota bacterium]|nr:UDP-glucose/GDP-mannose dehydrogenase family protein [Pseudomonadota bacterium]